MYSSNERLGQNLRLVLDVFPSEVSQTFIYRNKVSNIGFSSTVRMLVISRADFIHNLKAGIILTPVCDRKVHCFQMMEKMSY